MTNPTAVNLLKCLIKVKADLHLRLTKSGASHSEASLAVHEMCIDRNDMYAFSEFLKVEYRWSADSDQITINEY